MNKMNQNAFENIELDKNYSTTRRVIKADPQVIAGLAKQPHKPEDKFETVLFLPEGEGRQGEGGLRTQGYFKVGGIIPSPLTPNPSPENKPLITVVTVVFNGEKFLEETILSVINQTYDNVEYIIIDGGSTDGTLDIIKKYEHAIDYWVSEKDKGIYDAMNKGISCATGNFIGLLNADDLIYEQSLLLYANEICLNRYDYLYSSVDLTRLSGEIYGIFKPIKSPLFFGVLRQMPFAHQSFYARLSVYKKIGLYNLKYKLSADFDFLYSVLSLNLNKKDIGVSVGIFRDGGVSQDLIKSISNSKLVILDRKSKWWALTWFYYRLFRSKFGLVKRRLRF